MADEVNSFVLRFLSSNRLEQEQSRPRLNELIRSHYDTILFTVFDQITSDQNEVKISAVKLLTAMFSGFSRLDQGQLFRFQNKLVMLLTAQDAPIPSHIAIAMACPFVVALVEDGRMDGFWPGIHARLSELPAAGLPAVLMPLLRLAGAALEQVPVKHDHIIRLLSFSDSFPQDELLQAHAIQLACALFVHPDSPKPKLRRYIQLIPRLLLLETLEARRVGNEVLEDLVGSLGELDDSHMKDVKALLEPYAHAASLKLTTFDYPDFQRAAMELLLSLLEAMPGLVRKSKTLPKQVMQLGLQFLSSIADNLEEWKVSDDEDQKEICMEIGEQILDRLALVLGPKKSVPLLQQLVPDSLRQGDWRMRYAGLMALNQAAEAVAEQKEALAWMLETVEPFIGDAHPRVRYATINCVGQFAHDFAENVDDTVSESFLRIIRLGFEDPLIKLQAHAMAALINVSDDTHTRMDDVSASFFLSRIHEALQNGNATLLPHAITCVAVLAKSASEQFDQWYTQLATILIGICNNPQTDKALRCRCLESLTTLCMHLSPLRIEKELPLILEALQQCTVPFSREPNSANYIFASWARLVKSVPQATARYVRPLLGLVGNALDQLGQLQRHVHGDDCDHDHDEEHEHNEGGMSHEQEDLLGVLCALLSEVQHVLPASQYQPDVFLQKLMKLVNNGDQLDSTVAETCVALCKQIATLPPDSHGPLQAFFEMVLDCVREDPRSGNCGVLQELLESLCELENAAQVLNFVNWKALMDQMVEGTKQLATAAKDGANADEDEEIMNKLLEEVDQSCLLMTQINSHIAKTARDQFWANIFEGQPNFIAKCMSENIPELHRLLAFAMADGMEYNAERCTPQQSDTALDILFQALSSPHPHIKRGVGYAARVAAEKLPRERFHEWALDFANQLSAEAHDLEIPEDKEQLEDAGAAIENILSGIVSICVNHGELVPRVELLPFVVEKIQEIEEHFGQDEDECEYVLQQLCKLLTEKDNDLLGADFARLGGVLDVLVLHGEGLRAQVTTAVLDLNRTHPEALRNAFPELTPEVLAVVRGMLHHVD